MAMLAEPRRKQKFGSDPRNTFWSNDDSKFGQRMLERMGWSKGKGLGASESGRTEHITASFRKKDDARGVGCSKNHADNWLAHQDDFNSLLESLNTEQDSAAVPNTNDSNPKGVASLEEKSKSSRSRVHYHKFTRGKDLSSRSAEDLNCIFGKRVKRQTSESNTPLSQSESNSDEDSNKEAALSPGPDSEEAGSNATTSDDVSTHGIKTITSSSSIQEYFAQKMAELKKRQAGASDSPRDSDEGSSGADGPRRQEGAGHSSADADSSQWKRKVKKKRKSEEHDQQQSVDSVSMYEEKLLFCDTSGESVLASKKIKKKNKNQNAGEHEKQQEFATEFAENTTDEKASKKKKKKKKKNKRRSADCDGDSKVEKDVQMSLDEGCAKISKKKSKATDETTLKKEEVDQPAVVPKRKKSVRFSLGGDDLFVPGVEESVTSNSIQSDIGAEFKGKTTKKRKNESSDTVDAKKSKMDDVESKNVDSTQASGHQSEPVSVQSMSSSCGAPSGQNNKKKKNKKKKKPARKVIECFHGSNLSHVKGYGNL